MLDPGTCLGTSGNLTCGNLCLLCEFLCKGDLEPFLGCKGWQDHTTEDGLDGCPVRAWWHPVYLGKEVGSSQDIVQVGVLRSRTVVAMRCLVEVVPHSQGLPALPRAGKTAWLCPKVEVEEPLLLWPQSMCRLSTAVPSLTGGQGHTQPRTWQPCTGCGRWSTTTVFPVTPAQAWLSLCPYHYCVRPCTHIVRVECQWMGTAPVPCPEGDTRTGFLAQGEKSQAQECVPLAAVTWPVEGRGCRGCQPYGAGLTCSGG